MISTPKPHAVHPLALEKILERIPKIDNSNVPDKNPNKNNGSLRNQWESLTFPTLAVHSGSTGALPFNSKVFTDSEGRQISTTSTHMGNKNSCHGQIETCRFTLPFPRKLDLLKSQFIVIKYVKLKLLRNQVSLMVCPKDRKLIISSRKEKKELKEQNTLPPSALPGTLLLVHFLHGVCLGLTLLVFSPVIIFSHRLLFHPVTFSNFLCRRRVFCNCFAIINSFSFIQNRQEEWAKKQKNEYTLNVMLLGKNIFLKQIEMVL